MRSAASNARAKVGIGQRKASVRQKVIRENTNLNIGDKTEEELIEESMQVSHFWKSVRSSAETQKKELREALVSIRSKAQKVEKVNLAELLLFDPSGRKKVAWDFFIGFVVFYSIISIPLRMSFEIEISCTLFVLDWIETSFFGMDLFVNFNTAVQEPITEKLITNRTGIAKDYMKLWFWIDLLSTLPIAEMVEQKNYCASETEVGTIDIGVDDADADASDLKTIRLVRIMRLTRLMKLARVLKLGKVAQHIEALNISPALLNVGKVVIQIFFFAHMFSCFWHYITLSEVIGDDPDQKTWRRKFEENFHQDMDGYRDGDFSNIDIEGGNFTGPGGWEGRSSLAERYWAAFYWTIATMLAVGYGDIAPTNRGERIYAIFTMLCGGIMFGAVIAQVTRLIEGRNPQARAFKQRMDELKAYLTEKNLPASVRKDAKEAYTYFYSRQSTLAETGIFNELPSHLLIKLIHNIYYKEIERIDIFRNSDDSFVQQLLLHCKPFQAAPGEQIFGAGDVAEEVVFIMIGLVRISIHDGRRDVIVGYAKEGGYFGDFEYYKRGVRIATYHAVYNCNLLSIANSSLDEAIDSNVDAGLEFKREMSRRFEQVMRINKLRTCAMDPPKSAMSMTKIRAIAIALNQSEKGKPEGSERNTFNMMIKRLTSFEGMKSAAKAKVAVTDKTDEEEDQMPEYSDTESESEDDLAVKVTGDPTTPKIHVKNMLWVDGSMRGNYGLALESSPVGKKDERPMRVLRYDENGVKMIEEETITSLGERHVIYHKGSRKLKWDAVIGIFIIYNVLLIPVQMGFKWPTPPADDPMSIIDVIVDVAFTIDIFLSCRSSYFDEDEDAVITDHWQMFLRYLKTWFLIDILAIIPFYLSIMPLADDQKEDVQSLQLIRFVRLLRLLKLARLAKLGHHIGKLEDTLGINPITFDLMKMMLEVAFIGHMLACLWWAARDLTTKSWADYVYPLDQSDVAEDVLYSEQYVVALYWSFTTLATVGYGNIVPTNMTHRIVVILIMVLGATVFGYIVANVSTLMSDLDQTAARVSERISEITEFLAEKNCPRSLSGSIVRHFRHMFSQTSAFDEPGILQRLPNSIIRDILLTQHRDKVNKIALFRFIDNQSVVLFLFRMMTPVYFDINQAILKEGQLGNEVYFITQGHARVYKAKSVEILIKLRQTRAKARKEQEIKHAQERDRLKSIRRKSVGGLIALSPTKLDQELDTGDTPESDMKDESEHVDALGEVHEGDFIGHVALMYAARHTATVRASSSCNAYSLSRYDFQTIVRNHPGVALVLQMAFGEAVYSLEKDISKSYSRTKRVDFLAELKKKHNDFKERKEEELRKTREEAIAAAQAKSRRSSFTLGPGHNLLAIGKSLSFSVPHVSKGGILHRASNFLGGNKDKDYEVNVIKQKSLPTISDTPETSTKSNKLMLETGDVSDDDTVTNSDKINVDAPFDLIKMGVGKKWPSNYAKRYVAGEWREGDPLTHRTTSPQREQARKRWNIIKKAMSDAKVTATVARMNASKAMIKAEMEGKSPNRSIINRLSASILPQKKVVEVEKDLGPSVFARAMQSKIGAKVGIALNETQMAYDSEEEELSKPLVQIKSTAIKERHRSHGDMSIFMELTAKQAKSRSKHPVRRMSFPSRDGIVWKSDNINLHII